MKCKKKMALLLVMIAALTVSLFPCKLSLAGDGSIVLDSSTLSDAQAWNNLGDSVTVENGKLIFPGESDKYTRFISMSEARISEELQNVLKAECSLKLTQLPEGESFVLGLGLNSIESGIGEVGNIEVTFTNDNGIKVGVVAYKEEGKATVVCEPTAASISLNKNTSVKVEVERDSMFSLQVNGKTIYSGSIPVDGNGRVGFIQTQKCGAEISDLKVHLARYERPENAEVSEDFENGMDTSVLTAKAIYRYSNMSNHGAGIKEYNGSNVFMMENIGWSYIGTLYDYSNFEMTFDVPYLLTESTFYENGDLQYVDTGAFVVCFGNAQTDAVRPIYDDSAEALFWEGNTVYSSFNREKHSAKHEYWQSDKGFSIQVKVVDKYMTVGMKWLDETEFKTVMEYSLGNVNPLGKIHIWIPERANMAIDNLVIKNLDNNPNLIETQFKSGEIPYKDYEYTPFERVYQEDDSADTLSVNVFSGWGMLIPAVLVIGVAAPILTAVLTKKKGGEVNEA